ncbi:VOC family protein [Pantoea agglomerans]|uniref:VOC family protein n=1 Tax=Enterobacter agglomerans TaxID=549 RepID=UPI001877641E|nr:VOC family protein [Pantoea agglomerans]MBE5682124.1 VOC family protein [Pantoea agglomerans]
MSVQVPQPILDHAVINVADQLDSASARFRRLGFQLTERGHHSLGSSNHLAIFGENYLELLGYETGKGSQRADLWQTPLGLSGLVWKSSDAESEFQHLQRQDLDDEPPAAFHRPVTLPDGSVSEAHFRTVRIRPSLVPNGRSFFCQHLTPEAVWQPAWQRHPNGVRNISELVIVAQDPALSALVYSRLFGAAKVLACPEGAFVLRAGAATVRFASADYAQQRFGPLPEDYDGSARMVALGFETEDLALVKRALVKGEIAFQEQPKAIVVESAEGFNLALRFN